MIHRALNSIPARPVMFIAPTVVLLVLGIYYWNRHVECTSLAQQRAEFIQQIELDAEKSGTIDLASLYASSWQHVKVFNSFKPRQQKAGCPLNWDWPGEDRRTIIDAGLLSVLIFFNEGAVSNYIEFRGDQIVIDEFEDGLSRESAKFTVKKHPGKPSAFRLTKVP